MGNKLAGAVTREIPCPKCEKAGRPKKGNIVLEMIAKNRLDVYKIESIKDAQLHTGITPHIVSWDLPVKIEGGQVEVRTVCCINVCGISIKDIIPAANGEKMIGFDILEINVIKLPYADFVALRDNWIDSGYEL